MDYKPANSPRLKQAEALAQMENAKVFALLMAMRTGKTFVTLTDFGRLELAGEVQDLLVIAPGGCYDVWIDEAKKHLSEDLLARCKIFMWKSSAGAPYERRLKAFLADRSGPRIFIVNVEALSSVKMAKESVIQFLKARQSMCAIDESTTIANSDSARTKFINGQLRHLAKYRRILSGLPTPRDPIQLYSQFWFLDWEILGFKSVFAFRGYYAQMEPMFLQRNGKLIQIQTIVGFKHLDEMAKRIEPYSYRCRLEDCYDAPKAEYFSRKVELTAEQRRIYNEMRDFSIAQLEQGGTVTANAVITAMLRLHQILCGHVPEDDTGVIQPLPENRIKTLIGLLDDYDGKAVIWCSYDFDVKRISEALKKHFGENSVSRFWGGNRNTREEEEELFKTLPERRFMVATAAAGGRGRDWAVANLVLYFSNTNNLEHRSQSEERPQAVNKFEPVTYGDLIVPGTVDESFILALREKIDLAAIITRDNYKDWLI